jgi:hypothetical protein
LTFPEQNHSWLDRFSPEALQVERILGLCAHPQINPEIVNRLAAETVNPIDWEHLIFRAEFHGLGPLAYIHLKNIDGWMPLNAQRALRALFLRHRDANAVRAQVLSEILALLANENLPVILLKGAALAFLVYPQPGLRPMRDIDVLVKPEDAERAQKMLLKTGFVPLGQQGRLISTSHQHLPALAREINGITICVEVHSDLFPTTRYYHPLQFDDLKERAVEFQAGNVSARTLGYEDMLWHIYRHALGPPLLASPLRFIHIADMVGLVEAKFEQIDWKQLKLRYPPIMRIIPLLHCLSPLPQSLMEQLSFESKTSPKSIGLDYQGWPRVRMQGQPKRELWEAIKHTIAPPEWWLRLFYAASGQSGWLWARFIRHPLHLIEWSGHYARAGIIEH